MSFKTMTPQLTTSNRQSPCSLKSLVESEARFSTWLDFTGYASYDPYDLWGTRLGLWSRKTYYKNSLLGLPLIAPFILADFVFPSIRRLFVKKCRYATADAQLVLAFINMYKSTSDSKYLDKAKALADEILEYSIEGYSGPCWGYPFDWQNAKDTMWAKNTPYITCTPYCFEFYLALYDVTGENRYLDLAENISRFVFHDLNDTCINEQSSAGSYSPIDNSKVINASAYRAWVLIEAGNRFDKPNYTEKGVKNLNFVLESQCENGSWLYAIRDDGNSFIDHFHTCFNLKNLFKLNRILKSTEVESSIRKGFEYYRTHLFHEDGNPKSFSQEPRFQVTQTEMYNFAESITLGTLLKPIIPEAYDIAHLLAERLVKKHQRPEGYFKTRIFKGDFNHTFPFLRWPQAQLYFSITNLILAEKEAQ